MRPEQKAELRGLTKQLLEREVEKALAQLHSNRSWRWNLRRHAPSRVNDWRDGDDAVRASIVEVRLRRYALEAAAPDHTNERALQALDIGPPADLPGAPHCWLCNDTGSITVHGDHMGAPGWLADCPNGCKERLENEKWGKVTDDTPVRWVDWDGTKNTATTIMWGNLSRHDRKTVEMREDGELVGGYPF